MRLNSLKLPIGSKSAPRRVGRGIGCGSGKTCGRGHKGQKSRRGSYRKVGFEGGQMPLQRRLPKVGFNSRISAVTDELRLHELSKVDADIVNMESLLSANLISKNVKRVKIIDSGKIDKAVSIQGLAVTKGARKAIESTGGKILEG